MIEVRQVSKNIAKKTILDNITFQINSGECVALIGPNGAGKTTLMSCILGDKQVSNGQILIESLHAAHPQLKKRVAVLKQENVVPSKLTVKELIDFEKSVYPNHLTDDQIQSLLQFNPGQYKQLAEKLSGGQKRLLSFVLMLIGQPTILVLDEPTAAMDTSTRKQFWEIIAQLKQEKKTILYSSHYIEEVEHTADRILVLNKGKLLKDTTPYAMRVSDRYKQFRVPLTLISVVQGLSYVEEITEHYDTVTFVTQQTQSVWESLQKAGCQLDDIEVTNRTLLDSIFMAVEAKQDENI